MLKKAGLIFGELSREYGLVSIRFKQAHEGRITPERCAQDYVESHKKIQVLLGQLNEMNDNAKSMAGDMP